MNFPLLQMTIYALQVLLSDAHRAVKRVILRTQQAILNQAAAVHDRLPIVLTDALTDKPTRRFAYKANLAFPDHLRKTGLSCERIPGPILVMIVRLLNPINVLMISRFCRIWELILVDQLRNGSSLIDKAHFFLVKLTICVIGPKLVLISYVAKHDCLVGFSGIKRHVLILNLTPCFVLNFHSINLFVINQGGVSLRPNCSSL